MPDHRSDAPARGRESGSAYLATLLLLVLLTIVGLSLAVITQTEVLIGSSEKQAVRQLFASSSGVQQSVVYQIVSRSGASHRMRMGQRSEDLLGQSTVIADDICTTTFFPISQNRCDLCMGNEDEYVAQSFAVTAVALRRGDAALGARKTIGAVTTLEPWAGGSSLAGAAEGTDEDRKAPTDLTIDHDTSTEVDPCEGLKLKI